MSSVYIYLGSDKRLSRAPKLLFVACCSPSGTQIVHSFVKACIVIIAKATCHSKAPHNSAVLFPDAESFAC